MGVQSEPACSSKKYYFLEYLVCFLTKGRRNWRSYYRCTWYTYHIKDALDNHEQTGGGACCKRPRQRGTDASFTCVLLRSCRDVRFPRHLPNAKTAAFFQCHPDETTKKTNIVFRRSSDRGEYATTCVIYMHKFRPTHRLLFVLTWGGVWCRFLVLLSTPT